MTCALGILLVACGRGQDVASHPPSASADSALAAQAAHVREVVAAGGVVDSIIPVAEALERFRRDIPRVDSLANARPSVQAVVERLARAVGAGDTAALHAMTITRGEFAWLFYEHSPLSRPPYEAPPSLLWGQIQESSSTGLSDLLRHFAGARLAADSLTCPAPEAEGPNRLYKRCTVRLSAPGRAPLSGNLFGTILERDGRFKLVSLANRI